MTDAPAAGFARRWIVRVTIAEAAGFAVAAGVGASLAVTAAPTAIAYPAAVLAGAVEGLALGTGQYSAMRGGRPGRAAWLGATAGAAAVAWALGMLPSTIGVDLESPTTWVLLAFGAVLLLASIPVAQWLVLRAAGRRDAGAWVPVTMGAWALAILWTAAPSPFIDERSPFALVIVLYVIAGVLMAVTVAALTAPLARRLFAGSPSRSGR
ncbi:hypothetical protein [Pseudolysinimonas yzui]|uniref:Uncharacterized protein n=1 Tax=Pseudolysinimonas yzui TaxID=2708254 RepID=A0A8J3GST8_9MICO|nr:hypothetical protein [Pseudolysinimonas yzui]GHF24585.1 hypothetical protein GCM10011600_27110 [Pseudolysinimonas yzui]